MNASRRGILAVVLAGALIGTVTAVASRGAAPRVRISTATPLGPPVQHIVVKPVGPAQIVARMPDPRGGPPWVLRRFVVNDHHRNGKTYNYPCVQLGRERGSRFGWVGPGDLFRAVGFDLADVPFQCGAEFHLGRPNLQAITLTTDASRGTPLPAATVVWGALPPDAVSARLRDGTTLRAGRHGAALTVLGAHPVGEPAIRGILRLRSGARRPFTNQPPPRRPGQSQVFGAHVAVRVPDPAGGAAWGILAGHDARGRTCLSAPGRVVGSVLSSVEPRLGLATPDPFGAPECPARRRPTAAHPIRISVALFAIHDEDPTGSVQLRRLTGRTALYARTTPAVRTVTITTSRDVRTLVPDPVTHLVLAVYDGTFPGERARFTARLASGRTVTVIASTGA